VVLGTAGPRDIVALGRSCATIPAVKQVLCDAAAPLLKSLSAQLDELADIRDLIARTLVDEPPALTREGGFTRDGFDPEIDELRTISRSGRQVIADMETAERTRTGISSLKVRFNRVFGYYIEISKSNLHLAPADYERKQTIAGGERFSTPALRDYETKILGADERILTRELDVFDGLRRRIAGEASRIQVSARATRWRVWPKPRCSATTPSRTSTTATISWRPTSGTRWSNPACPAGSFPTTSISTARRGTW
jgi:DNA mismatch repair protein MutS